MQATHQDIDLLGNWEGYTVYKMNIPRNEQRPIRIDLQPKHGWWGGCGRCGCTGCEYHDRTTRIVRDLPVFGQAVELRVIVRRVVCPVCGPSRESIPWLDRYARITTRLAKTVCRMAEIMTIKDVAKTFLLAWHTVKNTHKRYLKQVLEPVDLNGVTELLIDEFAIQKGHRYATVVVDATRKHVLWVGRGRSRASIRPFFELLGEQRLKIKAVALDMSSAYINEVAEQCPQAQVIFDHFHVIVFRATIKSSKVQSGIPRFCKTEFPGIAKAIVRPRVGRLPLVEVPPTNKGGTTKDAYNGSTTSYPIGVFSRREVDH